MANKRGNNVQVDTPRFRGTVDVGNAAVPRGDGSDAAAVAAMPPRMRLSAASPAFAAQAAADIARITLVADVVRSYTQVCAANEELAIGEMVIANEVWVIIA